MAKVKYDGVVEAVHYTPGGQVDWVRVYMRRGQVFTDRMKLDRETLVGQIKAGKRLMVGERIPYLGANFEVTEAINIRQANRGEILVVGDEQSDQDHLLGVPII